MSAASLSHPRVVALAALLLAPTLSRAAFAAAEPADGSRLLAEGTGAFRAGDPGRALAAFDAAARAAVPPAPGPLAFNRAAALFALERFTEAEAAFVSCAKLDPHLAALAYLNAGHAAISSLSSGAAERARQHATRAAAAASSDALRSEMDDLRSAIEGADGADAEARRSATESAYSRALQQQKAGDLEAAAATIKPALTLDPKDGELRLLAATIDYDRDQRRSAREGFQVALALDLDEEARAEAQDYLELLSGGLASSGRGPSLSVALIAGYDSNVAQLGPTYREVTGSTSEGGMFAETLLDAGYGLRLAQPLFLRLGYSFDQIANATESFDQYNAQLHALEADLEATVGAALRLGLRGWGGYSLAGLRPIGPFERTVGLEARVALDETDWTSTVLTARVSSSAALADAAEPYAGTRMELLLHQSWGLRWVRVAATARYRRERVGVEKTIITTDALPLRLRRRVEQVVGAMATYNSPYSNDAAGLGGEVRLPLDSWRLAFGGRYDHIEYDVPWATSADGRVLEATRRQRTDDRYGGHGSVGLLIGDHLEVGLRYEATKNVSTTAPVASADRNYVKHVVTSELTFDW